MRSQTSYLANASPNTGLVVSSLSQITTLSDQAIEWVILLHSGSATKADKQQAQQWRNRSPSHQAAYQEAEQLWQEMGRVLQARKTESPIKPATQKRKMLSHVAIGLAATVLISTLITQFSTITDLWLSDYHTSVGEQKNITLSDGSQVMLNTDTALAIDWQSDRRYIKLLHGQAQFTVAHDAKRAFEVETDDAVVKALGTIFEVLAEAQDTRITVVEHAVSIKASQDTDYNKNIRIEAGQQARYSRSKGLETIETVNLKQNSAWQRGKLLVKNQVLVDVIADLNRYYQGKILITDDKLSQLRVSGAFPLNDYDTVMAMLEHSLPLKVGHITPWLTLIQNP